MIMLQMALYAIRVGNLQEIQKRYGKRESNGSDVLRCSREN